MAQYTNSFGTVFVVFLVMFFFMIMYASFQHGVEGFVSPQGIPGNNKRPAQNDFYNSGDINVYQGFSIPPKYTPTKADFSDPSAPSVDGTADGPRSMFMFSLNKSSPECCRDSPYSTSGGCVCLSDNQYKLLSTRGSNHTVNGCKL